MRLLEVYPEWRAELHRLVLTDELLELPEKLAHLSEQVAVLIAADVGKLKGWGLETRFRNHCGACFGELVRRAHPSLVPNV